MLPEFWFSLMVFTTIAAFTPGPNNLMVAASGMNYGFRRTVPHILGISFGFPVLLLCVIFGAGAIFAHFPLVKQVMRILSGLFILYVAWKIATAETDLTLENTGRPLTLAEGALFQWINPKAWAVAIAVTSLYVPNGFGDVQHAFTITLFFFLVTVACCATWTSFGSLIRRFLQDPRKRRQVNWGMAIGLVLTMIPIFLDS